jgi:arylsulfatase A-like enzyme
MPAEAPPTLRLEPLGACGLRAAALGALGSAFVGAVESAKILEAHDARYVQWAAKLITLHGVGYGALGAVLGVLAALFARVLFGRPQHRAIPPSACGGLGAIGAITAFVFGGQSSPALLLPLALAGASLALALRELLAWKPFFTRLSTWWALLGLAAAANVFVLANGLLAGGLKWIAFGLAAAGAVVAVRAFLGKQAPHAALLGVVALLVMTALAHPERRIPEDSGAGRTDVLLVSIDTLRADHLGCYGNANAKTPTIDALAAEGVVFEDATSQANTTGPSHTTMLTGLYPAEHGALSNGVRVSNRVKTLADALSRTHSSAAFVSGFTLADELCGLASRFDWYDDQMARYAWLPRIVERSQLGRALVRFARERGVELYRADRPAGQTVDAAISWLNSRGDEPLFTFLHLYDPHAPYEPPEEFVRLHAGPHPADFDWYDLSTEEREELVTDPAAVEQMKALYAAEISYADAQVARLIEELKRLGRWERTLLVLTSDHGEGLGAHGYWFDHGTFLYDEELHVPLILRFPGAKHAGVRVKHQVRLLDIAPTILDHLGVRDALTTSGESLVTAASGAPDAAERASYALSDIAGDVSGFPIEGRRMSLRSKGHKLIWSSTHWLDTQRVPEREEFYVLARDKDELDDLRRDGGKPAHPFEDLARQLEAWREATGGARSDEELAPEVIEQLKKLGYL